MESGKPKKIKIDNKKIKGSKTKKVMPVEKINLKMKAPKMSLESFLSLIKKIKRGTRKIKPNG